MEHLYIPGNYQSELSLYDTQIAIKTVKDFFQQTLAEQLYLLRVSAPLFVTPGIRTERQPKRRGAPGITLASKNRMTVRPKSFILWQNGNGYALKQYGFVTRRGPIYRHERHPPR